MSVVCTLVYLFILFPLNYMVTQVVIRWSVSEFYALVAAFRMYCIDLVATVCVLCFRKINMMTMITAVQTTVR